MPCKRHRMYNRACVPCTFGSQPPRPLLAADNLVTHSKQCLCTPIARKPESCPKCCYKGHMCNRCGNFTFGKCRRCP